MKMKCPKCDRSFKNKRGLRTHMSHIHNPNKKRKPEPQDTAPASPEQRINRALVNVIRQLLEGYEL